MKAIIAINNLGYIGKDNKMLWRSTEDFKHFREKTMGCRCLVGYNTYSTLPPLKGREIILDKWGGFIEDSDDIWCIGGKKTYEKYQHLFTEIHISHIDDNNIGDTMAPDFSKVDAELFFHYNFKTNNK